jgi:hypothetical protein
VRASGRIEDDRSSTIWVRVARYVRGVSGMVIVDDPGARFRFVGEDIREFLVEGERATIVGTGRVGRKAGYEFKMVLWPGEGGTRFAFDLTGPDRQPAHLNKALTGQSLVLMPGMPRGPNVTFVP